MRGKYSKKKSKSGLGAVAVVLVLILGMFACLWLAASRDRDEMPLPEDTQPTQVPETAEATVPFTFNQEVEGVTSFDLGDGLNIRRYGKYIGLYMEDGSDEFVENVMMIEVENTGIHPIQYAKITITGPAGDASFVLTTLLPGDTMVVLEASRKPYSDGDVYTEAQLENLALFQEMPGTLEDRIRIQPLEGGFNITNISGEDITGQICVYFKDVAGDMLYGGITYVARIDGLAKDEVKQIMSSNFSEKGSLVVFIQILE